jgi:hypothetical protein
MRLWHSGCETNELGSDLTDFGINATPTSRYQYDTAIKHGGLRSIKFNGTGPAFIQSPVFVGLTKAYARAYFYPVTTPPATTGILGFNSNITGHWAYFCLRPDMQIEVRVNTGLTQVLGGPSGWTLGLGGWSMLEMFCDTAGVVQGKINGALWYWAGTPSPPLGRSGPV